MILQLVKNVCVHVHVCVCVCVDQYSNEDRQKKSVAHSQLDRAGQSIRDGELQRGASSWGLWRVQAGGSHCLGQGFGVRPP